MGAPAYINPDNWSGADYAPALATDLTTLQNAIVAQINSAFAANPAMNGISASGWADDPEMKRITSQRGDVLVIFSGADYDAPETTDAIAQRRTLEWEITIRARGLGWNDAAGAGLYAIVEAARIALTGFRVPGALLPGMWPKSEKLLGRDSKEGVWVTVATYAMDVLAVAAADAYTLPNLTKATLNETVSVENGASETFDAAAEAVQGGGSSPEFPTN